MPVMECDTEHARERLETAGVAVEPGNTDHERWRATHERLETAGVAVEPGNTDHERWRATHEGATAVAYEGKLVIQGANPAKLEAIVREAGGRAHCYFDGASRGNPGPAAVGWVIVDSSGIVTEGSERIGETTNNRAEYEALLRVLELAREYGFSTVDIRGDSQLVVEQVRGAWDTNDPGLRERRVRARELLDGFDEWSIEHVPREVNERADRLANEAFDG